MAENKKNEIAETGKKQAEIIVNNALIDGLARQIEQKQQYGLSFPNDYNPVNALNGAYLVLQETTDANKRPVLQSCTQTSIAHCLMDMVTMGLSMQKNQCYPVAYGGKLKLMVSYHGHKTMAHRCGAKTIRAEVIYEGDEFEYHIKNGCKVIDKHTQNFENLDLEKIAGAYCIINMNDGSQYVEVMNINQLKTAWSKGYGYKPGKGVHKDFTDMMAKKLLHQEPAGRLFSSMVMILLIRSKNQIRRNTMISNTWMRNTTLKQMKIQSFSMRVYVKKTLMM
jgi:recombination protein RecT